MKCQILVPMEKYENHFKMLSTENFIQNAIYNHILEQDAPNFISQHLKSHWSKIPFTCLNKSFEAKIYIVAVWVNLKLKAPTTGEVVGKWMDRRKDGQVDKDTCVYVTPVNSSIFVYLAIKVFMYFFMHTLSEENVFINEKKIYCSY